MTGMTVRSGTKSASIHAVKIKADGTRIPLGVVAYWHRNPLRRWWWRIKQAVRPFVGGND